MIKKLISIAAALIFSQAISAQNLLDSTPHQRFIMHVLKEYAFDGRWIFVKIVLEGNRNSTYEVIHPSNIYFVYASRRTTFNEKMFYFDAYQTLRQIEEFARYPGEKYSIQGVAVDMGIYNTLIKKPISEILNKYFKEDRTLKKKYKKYLYELIAVCYTNNVKLVTPEKETPYYEVFR